MRKGDILLVKYRFDPVGFIVCQVTKSNWNHVAWVLNDHTLIEATTNGIKEIPLKKYSSKWFFQTKLVRIPRLSQYKLNKAMQLALREKKTGSYFKLLCTFFCILFNKTTNMPRLTCSGLIAQCLNEVGWVFTSVKNPVLITPEDINKGTKEVNK